MFNSKRTRREFVETTFGAWATANLGSQLLAEVQSSPGGITTRPFGTSGERVSILCLGGWHIGAVKDPKQAIRIMHAAMDQGINFFDNAWDYHAGGSEKIMGSALAMDGRRKKVFLMTKNCERDYQGSLKNLEDSLRRLKTDYLDLWQFHELVYDNDPDWIFEKGGMKAALEARKAGKVRFIGFTGHKDPRIHLKMLQKPFSWDAVQMPINVMDAHYRSFQKEVVPVCLEKGVAALGMKSLGGGYPKGNIPGKTGIPAQELIRYALSVPITSLVVAIASMQDLEQDLEVARHFQPMGELERTQLLASVAAEASDGRYELFKSTQAFDGPLHRAQHGFVTD